MAEKCTACLPRIERGQQPACVETTLLLFLVLCVTGALELFYYAPTADGANDSLRWIAHVIPYGWLIRNVHFWAGQLMVITVGLHMARVVFTGAYKRPRHLNNGTNVPTVRRGFWAPHEMCNDAI